MRVIFMLAALVLATPSARAQSGFEHVKWFQIHFCRDVNHLTYLPQRSSSELPAYGFAADKWADGGGFHYYEWDMLSGRELAHLEFPGSAGIARIDLDAATKDESGRYVMLLSKSHDVPVFDLETKTVVRRFAGHRQATRHGAIAPGRAAYAAADERNKIWIWREGDETMPFQRIDPAGQVAHLQFLESAAKLRVVTKDEIRVYDVEAGTLLATTPLEVELSTNGFSPDQVHFTADGTRFLARISTAPFVAMVDATTGVKVWDYDFGNLPPNPSFPMMPNWPKGVAYSPNGQCAVVGEWQGFRVFDPASGTERLFQRHNAGSEYYVFSPDGKYLISAGSCNLDVWKVPAPCAD